ncbi:MAG: family ATPase [Paenibacillus sp.]|jgi:hypothetical protein|nr:family ATPase [Paenibacillus sp.]
MKLKLPIGVSDFREIKEGDYYYADKSLLLRELMDNGSEAVLMPRPRRFGKTLNMSMLRYFYELTDTDTSGLFRDLAISRQGEAYMRHQGQYPVIYLTFKDVKCDDWPQCFQEMSRVIGEEYRRHAGLLESGNLFADERTHYVAIMERTADSSAYRNSLRQLSAWLERCYGRKTVILIDEYDTPIIAGYTEGYYDEVIGFMRHLLSGALKDNSSLEKGVLTGILRIAEESVFSGLNNLKVYSLLASGFSSYFGLTEPEVAQLLREYGAEQDLEEVKAWYNGYVFGETTIYNPWSIVNYVDDRDGARPYWVNTSSNDLVRQLLTEGGAETKKELERLVRGETIRKEIDDNISFRDIGGSTEALWSFLLFSGYLKIVSKEQGVHLIGELQIPNREVTYLFESIIRGWFDASIPGEQHRMMLEALVCGDIETFGHIFGDFVRKTFSLFDTGGEEPEKVYHAFVLGLLVGLRDSYEVKSNRESGYGRYDVMMIPRVSGRPDTGAKNSKRGGDKGVVIEFKKALRGETLEAAVAAGKKQLREKRYETELEERGVRDIVLLVIAFAGKEVRIEQLD